MATKRSYSAKAARKGKDIGKRGKNFSKIEANAGRKYGSKAAGKRVAGAILAKQREKESDPLNFFQLPEVLAMAR